MLLRPNGIDFWYIDESHDSSTHVVCGVAVPALRPVEGGNWRIVWRDCFDAAKEWRRRLADSTKIPADKELHAVKIASGRGAYLYGQSSFSKAQARGVLKKIVHSINFLPPSSFICSSVRPNTEHFGAKKLEAAMTLLFERMERQCMARRVNAMCFFDQGHPEYRALYRKAQKFLPRGSAFGGWPGGTTRNIPLDMFFEDGNMKDSKHCLFTQIADVVAYSAFMKIKSEASTLTDWQKDLGYASLYDEIEATLPNRLAQRAGPADGIVRAYA